ncbi:type 1 glutamine amidotransferase domain-containing protein [Legionella israelensis]|uniref:Intracellular protease, ThiJ/PfpI family n=1 Tax=Legionella israelensis TaxID=454 RepID=A0A0W0W1H7_9GAMM|nr:type 1 glutamine amidotransferase domain-containing protein [Legionella israelensis]KTD26105.1 intracellular protease, ThiJ/PfpI family [Legionella israelensis]QBS10108.1 type 1 glutamine amidotransferase [Legionella israelensis]QDP71081.1 type 1 glutamine amidotransferase [Legionella israelensis]SCY08070.1 protease I [Legionella israelensis DSM 19235]STX59694.1 intracellular protease, ThiJ/PfpI family [Legionella israelensis]
MDKLKGMKIAILVANGFEQVELEKPREALKEEGADTYIVSPEKNEVQGWHHFDKGDMFKVDVPLNEAHANDYSALLLPGGVINPDQLRLHSAAIEFIKEINKQNKPIAAICHGPWTLINAKAVHGRKVTSWYSIKCDLINAGAEWVDESVVKDDNLVTSRKPDDIPDFNKEMIELFQTRKI